MKTKLPNLKSYINEEDFKYDKSDVRIYRATCNSCGADRGYIRKTARHKMCQKCGQKGKVGSRLGHKLSLETIEKLKAEQTRRLALIGLEKRTLLEKRIVHNIRSRLSKSIRTGSATKNLGCSTSELKKHLESKWQQGMSWANYGKTGWHIDHIKPLSSFDLTDHEQFKKACHYTNLQPLWAIDNIRKSNKT